MNNSYGSKFHLVSYLLKDSLISILNSHSSSINACSYILHDKDDCVPHFHILLYLKCSRKSDEVLKWFASDVNTFINLNSFDKQSSLNYLLHSNTASVEDGKYPYNSDELCFFNCDLSFFMSERLDRTFDMISDLLNGYPLRSLCLKYGRDFIFHYKAILELANAIRAEEKV